MTNTSLRRFVVLGFLGIAVLPVSKQTAAEEKPLTRIAFGSCARQNRPQPIWFSIAEQKPQVFLFIGDNIYADTQDMDVMRRKYAMLGSKPGYEKLKTSCRVLAVWDDHDFGVNDGGREYPKKKQSQQVFLDFFGAPKDDPRRTREGVYYSETVGPPGKRVQFILLDTRYFRSALKRGKRKVEPGEGISGPYLPHTDNSTTILGQQQWEWLEKQLRKPAELRIVASSIQVIPNVHGWEKWGNFPHERRRLFELIGKTKTEGVVFISGDRHKAEISRLDDSPAGYPLYDITSSSLNQPSGNKTKLGVRWGNEINPHRVGLMYFEINFGMITVDWSPPDPVLRFQVRDGKGNVVLQQRTKLSELKPSSP